LAYALRAVHRLAGAPEVHMTKMKKIGCIFGIIVGIMVLGVGMLLFIPILQQRPRWPTVAEPSALLRECVVISDTAPAGEYPKEKWGPAIQALHPRFVFFEEKRINIILSTGGIGDSWGFMVYPDLRTSRPADVGTSRIIVPGIFTYIGLR
jgi:hypothetical protein